MDDVLDPTDALLRSAARRLKGHQRRLFQAEVATQLCGGSARVAERRFGWGRAAVEQGLHEAASSIRGLENFAARGRRCWEEQHPQRAADIRAIVEPHSYTDPELKSERRYSNVTAAEVLAALQEKGYAAADLPSARTMRDILKRLNYRLKRIQKGKPLKKTPETDAIFANVAAVRAEVKDDPQVLEISIDTKAKVAVGEYVRGGKKPDECHGEGREGLGPRPAGERQAGALRSTDAGEPGVDPGVWLGRDERFLGGRITVVVGECAAALPCDHTAGDLLG
jgi:hypothetical protein